MSSRPFIGPTQVIPNKYATPPNSGDMSADITSAVTILKQIGKASYQVSWNGTSPVGTVSVEGSNDYSLDAFGNVANAGSWDTLTFDQDGSPVQSIAVSGDTGSGILDLTATGIFAIRLVYTFTSGTGTLTATVNAKV